jgi:hypothetical protein
MHLGLGVNLFDGMSLGSGAEKRTIRENLGVLRRLPVLPAASQIEGASK